MTLKKAMPIIYQSNKHKQRTSNGDEQTSEMIVDLLKQVDQNCDYVKNACLESAYPLKMCGKRVNCCDFLMKSLFHESKQMGIVLRKSFKGTHIWIPPIPQ